jgi:D-alanine transaminase
MPPPLANLHGVLLPVEDVRISAQDRGFLFGDAVYEVLRVYGGVDGGKVWLEAEHFERLRRSLAEIRIRGVDMDRLRQRMHQTIAAGPFGDCMVYMHVTRGAAPRRHAFPLPLTPLELLWVQDYDDAPAAQQRQAGVKVITHPDIRWGRCDIKSTNLLANVLANQAAYEAGGVEALLYLADGTMSEASHSSFFTVTDGVIQTTPLRANILPGITRNFVCDLIRKNNLPLHEKSLSREELYHCDEAFLTGTTTEVMAVVRIDDRTIGGGVPGPVTRRLHALYAEVVRDFLKSRDR